MRVLVSLTTFLLRLIGGIVSALLLLAVVALLWLTLTTSGLRFVLDMVHDVAGDMVRIEHAEGRLLGTMELRNVQVRTDAAHVDVRHLHFSWVPGWLPAPTFYVARLHASGVRIALFSTEDDDAAPDDPMPPLDIELPLRLILTDVQVDDIHVERDGETITTVDSVRLSAQAQGRRLRVRHLEVTQPDVGRLSLRAVASFAPGLLTLETLTMEGPGALRAAGSVPLGGDAPLDLQITWEDLHWPPAMLVDRRLFTSPQGELHATGALDTPAVEGRIRIAPQGEIRLSGQWRGAEGFDADLAWTDLVDPTQPEAPLWRSPEGRLQAVGTPEAWRARLSAAATVHLPEEDAADAATTDTTRTLPLRVQLRANGDSERADITELRVDALDGRLQGSGDIAWTPEPGGRLNLRFTGLNPGALAADFPGSINGRSDLRFRLRDSGPDIDVELALDDSTLREHRLQLTASATLREEVLRLRRFELRSGASRLTASGRATAPFDLEVALRSPDLEEILPGLSGSARLDATVQGAVETLTARLEGEAEEVAFNGVALERLNLDGDIALADRSRLRLDLHGLRAGDLDIVHTRLRLEGLIDDHRLRLDSELPQGRLRLGLVGGLDLDTQQWQGAVFGVDVLPTDLEGWYLREEAPLQLSAGTVHLEPLCLDSNIGGTLCFRMQHDAARTLLAYRVDALTLAYLNTFLPPGMVLKGEVDGRGVAELRGGLLDELRADLDIGDGALTVPNQPTLHFGPGRLRADRDDDGDILATVEMGLAGGTLDGQVRLGLPQDDRAQAIDGELALRIPDIDFLPLFTTEVREASGAIEARLRLSGALPDPDVDARLQLRDGRIVLRTPVLDITDLRADIQTRPDRSLTLDARARSGDGEIRVSGDADVFNGPLRAELRVQGEDFLAARLPEARIWISPDLRVEVAERVNITGTLHVPRAEFEPQRFSGPGGVAPSGDVVMLDEAGEFEQTGIPVHARITVALGDRVSLTGFGLETRLTGSITLMEEPRRVTRARGALSLEDGRYYAYGQRLNIERGRIVYAGGPVAEPGLDFQAVRTPRRDIRVGIIVRGTIENPEFQLFSEPAMTQGEQLSWLVLGRAPPTGGAEGEEASAMQAAALALGLTGGDWLAQNIGGRVGFDEITVGAEDYEDSSQARLTVGKYIGSRFYIAYGVSLFQPGHVVTMRYDIGRGLSIRTEAGVETGADLLFTRERGER